MVLKRQLAIASVLLASIFVASADAQQQLDAYIDGSGLGALDPSDRRAIFAYLPRLTLLFDLSEETTRVRQQTAPLSRRPYRGAITHDGIEVLVLDDGESINRQVDNLKKYKFLVNRLMPVCRRFEDCRNVDLWSRFQSGLRRGPGWYTIEASQGGRFVGDADEPTLAEAGSTIWAIRLHDNVSGWVTRYVQSQRGPRNIEELGYITRLDRKHPLFRVYREPSEILETRCGQEIKTLSVNEFVGNIELFARVGGGFSVDNIPLPYANRLLQLFGMEGTIEAEASLEGRVTFKAQSENTNAVTFGASGQSWVTKTFSVKRLMADDRNGSHYKDYGIVISRITYECDGQTRSAMRNAAFTIYLSDGDETIDFGNPMPDLNVKPDLVHQLELQPPDYPRTVSQPALVGLRGANDHERLMSFLTTERGLPRSVAAAIITEINRSGSLD